METPGGKVDERTEDMEAGLAAPVAAFSCGSEGTLTARSPQAGDEETETTLQSDLDIEMGVDGPAAAAEPRDATRVELSVAAVAAVELSNLFFLLRGSETAGVTATEGIAVLAAFTAFLSAAGLLLARHAEGQRRRVVLVASAASLFVASVGTALSLLRAHGIRPSWAAP